MVNQRGIEANPKKISTLLEMSSPRKPKEVMSLADRVVALSRFVSPTTDRCAPFFDVLKGSKKFEWTDKCEQAFLALKEHLGRGVFRVHQSLKPYLTIILTSKAVSKGRSHGD